jgi:hypothetical protein
MKNGINLGEMNALLLKKIEELTLHLIQKEERLDKQDVRLNKQQEQISDILDQLKKVSK